MSGLSREGQAVIDAAAGGDDPSDRDRARVRAGLGQKIGAGVLIAATTTVSTSATATAGGIASATSVMGLGWMGKVVVLLAVAGAAGGTTYVVRSVHRPTPATQAPAPTAGDGRVYGGAGITSAPAQLPRVGVPSVLPLLESPRMGDSVEAPREKTITPSPAPLRSTAAVSPLVGPPSPAAMSATAVAPPSTSTALDAELDLLQQAQGALRAQDPARALSLFDRHAALYPAGALAEERMAGRVLALCALGRADGPPAASEFLRDHASSPLAGRVRTACPVR